MTPSAGWRRLLVRIDATDMPGASCGPGPDMPEGHHNVRVGLQRKDQRAELLGVTPGDAASAIWTIDCQARPLDGGAVDVRGPYVQGGPGRRFVHLSWVHGPDAVLFRRAKLWLDSVPPAVLADSVAAGTLVGHLGLSDDKGNPRCAAVRPPVIAWSAAAAG